MPSPCGLSFVVISRVDADHAGDTVTRRSSKGYIIYVNIAPVYCMSKKQTNFESSSFGNKMVAIK